jgi:hypothetical protein
MQFIGGSRSEESKVRAITASGIRLQKRSVTFDKHTTASITGKYHEGAM